jgi:Ribbon-helix-helix protein, copG family
MIFGYTEIRVVSRKTVTPKRRGRPATGRDPHVAFRIPGEMIAEINQWAKEQGLSRSEALRRLLDAGLKALRAKKR